MDLIRSAGGDTVRVSVLTPSIPSRATMLSECMNSVLAQTVDCWEHLIAIDADRIGCARMMNQLAWEAKGEWLLPLADDDLLLPGCLWHLLPWTDGASTIVYAPPLVWGRPAEPFLDEPPRIPSFALIHRDLWAALDGYNETLNREEDRDLWIRALAQRAEFRKIDAPTWVYRHHDGNKSFRGGDAA